MKEEYQSELLGAIHETDTGLYKIGVIDDKEMREYDDDCIVQKPKTVNETEKPLIIENVTA